MAIDKLIIKSNGIDPILIMMIGIPGSGKSTIANNIVIEREFGISMPKVHSADELRKEWYGNANDQVAKEHRGEENSRRVQEMKKRMLYDLVSGNDVVYDATNLSKRRRISFLNEMKNIECKTICVCAMTPFDVCVKNNEHRAERVVPKSVMREMYSEWNPPHYTEGFDGIIPIFNYGCNDNIQKYSKEGLEALFDRIDMMSQNNKHHKLTLGHHCRAAFRYVETYQSINHEEYSKPRSRNVRIAAMLHDIGKVSTQTQSHDGQCHYYKHNCVGAYESMFYLNSSDLNLDTDDNLYISNLIYYHMKPSTSWRQSPRSLKRDKNIIGEEMFADINFLHRADIAARDDQCPTKDFKDNNILCDGGVEIG